MADLLGRTCLIYRQQGSENQSLHHTRGVIAPKAPPGGFAGIILLPIQLLISYHWYSRTQQIWDDLSWNCCGGNQKHLPLQPLTYGVGVMVVWYFPRRDRLGVYGAASSPDNPRQSGLISQYEQYGWILAGLLYEVEQRMLR